MAVLFIYGNIYNIYKKLVISLYELSMEIYGNIYYNSIIR